MYTSFQGLATAVIDIIILAKGYEQQIVSVYANIPVWIIMIYSGGFAISLFFFGLYHLSLIARGRTTNEEIRGKYRKYKGNPFDKGLRRNCSLFWKTK
jgi:flagellar biosynthesis protein FlhB